MRIKPGLKKLTDEQIRNRNQVFWNGLNFILDHAFVLPILELVKIKGVKG